MKYSIAAVALAVAVAQAQLPNVPQCSLTCFTTALTTDGCSGLTDFKCHCSKPSLVAQVTPCVDKACSKEDAAKTASAVADTCKSVGVPLSVPAPSEGGSSSSESSSSVPEVPASSSSSSSSASTEEATSSVEAPEPATTMASNPTGVMPGVSSPTGGSSYGNSTVPFTGAAGKLAGSSVGFVVAAVAVAFAL